jgi:hypothetical protein
VVFGIDSTSEWYKGGFETHVEDGAWQLIYWHPGFVSNWASAADDVWKQAPFSPCTTGADNPDRVLFNVFGDPNDAAFKTKEAFVEGLEKVVDNLVAKYSNLANIELLTMTRAPDNVPCVESNRMSIVETYVDEAVAEVAASHPGLVTVSPKFFAPDCTVFTDGGPHFNATGGMTMAQLYGDHYSAE